MAALKRQRALRTGRERCDARDRRLYLKEVERSHLAGRARVVPGHPPHLPILDGSCRPRTPSACVNVGSRHLRRRRRKRQDPRWRYSNDRCTIPDNDKLLVGFHRFQADAVIRFSERYRCWSLKPTKADGISYALVATGVSVDRRACRVGRMPMRRSRGNGESTN